MFRVGQKVVCIVRNSWINQKQEYNIGPGKNEIVTIAETVVFENEMFLGFEEYPPSEGYDAKKFRPLDYDFVEEVIAQVQPKEEVLA